MTKEKEKEKKKQKQKQEKNKKPKSQDIDIPGDESQYLPDDVAVYKEAMEKLKHITREKLRERVTIEMDWFVLLGIHGSLCLSLRHPLNNGDSRRMIGEFVHRIGDILVEQNLLTPGMRDMTERDIDNDQEFLHHGSEQGKNDTSRQECGDCTSCRQHTKNPILKTGQEMGYHG